MLIHLVRETWTIRPIREHDGSNNNSNKMLLSKPKLLKDKTEYTQLRAMTVIVSISVKPVSYTHLDVYKRQIL